MALNIIKLEDLLDSNVEEEDIRSLLFSFKTIEHSEEKGAHDVEDFLHTKAVQFEKTDLARTYLIMSSYKNKSFLAGYFSITNQPLVIPKKNYIKMSNSLKKRLMGIGHKTDQENYTIKGFLLGQLGKNYSEVSLKANALTGSELLQLAQEKIIEAKKLVAGRVIHLECEDHQKIIEFYKKHGFNIIEDFVSPNGLRIMTKKLG